VPPDARDSIQPSGVPRTGRLGRLDWRRQQKILVLIQQVAREPFTGLGKPEPLRHQFSGCWSRRITEEHRLVYRVTEEVIVVVSCRHHY
jgi:toxin YoeB